MLAKRCEIPHMIYWLKWLKMYEEEFSTIYQSFLKKLIGFFFFFFCYTIASVLCFLVFWPRGMWDPSSPSRDRTCTPCIGRRSPNHWTAREVPLIVFDPKISLPKIQPKYTDVSAQRLFDQILKYKQTLKMNNQNL